MVSLKKSFAGLMIAAFVFAGFATPAKAQTVAELQALINQLMSQIAAMQGGSSTASSCTTFGLPGIMGVQQAVNQLGYTPALVADGANGPKTKAGVMWAQTKLGVSADGAWGAMTNNAYKAWLATCSGGTTNPGTTNPGTLNGTEGDLTFDVTLDSDVVIDLGDSEEVVAFDFEAEDGDVMVERVDFLFDLRPWLYFDEVNLLADGKEIASLSSSSDFSEVGSNWRARFSGLKQVVKEDETVEFTLELKALASMSGDRDGDTVTVTTESDGVRFVEGSGVVTTTGDFEEVEVEVTFDDTFGEGEVTVSIGDDSPENATIVLKDESRVSDVTVLEFNVEAEDSDITVNDVTLVLSTSASSVADTVYRASLYQGSSLLKSKSVSSATTVFDDVDLDIDEDEEETFTVKLEFNKAETLGLGTLTVESVKVDAENADFDAIDDTLTVDEEHQLISEGLVDTFDTKTSTTRELGDDTIGVFTFEFDLTAYEDDFFIADDGSDFGISIEGNGTTTLVDITNTNATLTNDNSYRINKGQTRSFTLKIEVSATSTSTAQAVRAIVDDLTFWTNSGMSTGEDTLTLGAPDYRSGQVSIIDAN